MTNSDYLNRDEMERLTGYKQFSRICQWFQERGFQFETWMDGYPKIRLEDLARRQTLRWCEALFLTHEQLTELTGYSRKKQQHLWLAHNGYKFDVGSDGLAKVLVAQVMKRQGIRIDDQIPAFRPDFSGLLGRKQ